MNFAVGSKVRFKGDPDKVTYVVDFHNSDHTYELVRNGDSSAPDYVPERLLEQVPSTVRFGDVYRGGVTGTSYLVLSRVDGDNFSIYDPLSGDFVNESGSNLTGSYYTLVRQGMELL